MGRRGGQDPTTPPPYLPLVSGPPAPAGGSRTRSKARARAASHPSWALGLRCPPAAGWCTSRAVGSGQGEGRAGAVGGHPHPEGAAPGAWSTCKPGSSQDHRASRSGWGSGARRRERAAIIRGEAATPGPARGRRSAGPRTHGQPLRGCGIGSLPDCAFTCGHAHTCVCMCMCVHPGPHLAELCGHQSWAHSGSAPHWPSDSSGHTCFLSASSSFGKWAEARTPPLNPGLLGTALDRVPQVHAV